LQIDFRLVRRLALALPDVEEAERRGSPVLKLRGVFLAGMAQHKSAEPGSLVVRSPYEERDLLIEDAPETYYTTDFYRPYPLVLVRLAHVTRDALHDLLSVSYRLTRRRHEVDRSLESGNPTLMPKVPLCGGAVRRRSDRYEERARVVTSSHGARASGA
jgi:hypothetical protein